MEINTKNEFLLKQFHEISVFMASLNFTCAYARALRPNTIFLTFIIDDLREGQIKVELIKAKGYFGSF